MKDSDYPMDESNQGVAYPCGTCKRLYKTKDEAEKCAHGEDERTTARVCHIHGKICDENLPVLVMEVDFEKFVNGKPVADKRKRWVCARCAGLVAGEFFRLMQKVPELGALAGMDVKPQPKIIKPDFGGGGLVS